MKIFFKIHKEYTLFIDQHDWKEISFSSHKNDQEKFESNNEMIALNIFISSLE